MSDVRGRGDAVEASRVEETRSSSSVAREEPTPAEGSGKQHFPEGAALRVCVAVVADDLGICSERDRGIFECFERGIVTDAVILPNGESAEAACREVFGLLIQFTRVDRPDRMKSAPFCIHLYLLGGRTHFYVLGFKARPWYAGWPSLECV